MPLLRLQLSAANEVIIPAVSILHCRRCSAHQLRILGSLKSSACRCCVCIQRCVSGTSFSRFMVAHRSPWFGAQALSGFESCIFNSWNATRAAIQVFGFAIYSALACQRHPTVQVYGGDVLLRGSDFQSVNPLKASAKRKGWRLDWYVRALLSHFLSAGPLVQWNW